MHYIEVENLTFYYDDEPVLEDVSYYVDPWEFVILTGRKWRCQVNADQKYLRVIKTNKWQNYGR